jgi:hypothetical protein
MKMTVWEDELKIGNSLNEFFELGGNHKMFFGTIIDINKTHVTLDNQGIKTKFKIDKKYNILKNSARIIVLVSD